MKKILILLLALQVSLLSAQIIEFDTYFALEDASGRRDTVWYGQRNAATEGYDPALGEEKAIQPVDSNTFLLTTSHFGEDALLKNKFYIKGETNEYFISIKIIFIDVEYPVTMRMDTSFFKDMRLAKVFFNRFFGSWCADPYLLNPWNDSQSIFYCLNDGYVIINEPPPVSNDPHICATSPWYEELDIKGKGKHNINAYNIGTFSDINECKDYPLKNLTLKPTNRVRIYPNPSTGEVNVLSDYGEGYIKIYDLLDRWVDTVKTVDKEPISLQLNSGIYILCFENKEQRKVLGKVVVGH